MLFQVSPLNWKAQLKSHPLFVNLVQAAVYIQKWRSLTTKADRMEKLSVAISHYCGMQKLSMEQLNRKSRWGNSNVPAKTPLLRSSKRNVRRWRLITADAFARSNLQPVAARPPRKRSGKQHWGKRYCWLEVFFQYQRAVRLKESGYKIIFWQRRVKDNYHSKKPVLMSAKNKLIFGNKSAVLTETIMALSGCEIPQLGAGIPWTLLATAGRLCLAESI